MGLSVSSLVSSLSSLLNWSKDKDVRILMLGLDSAGKVSRLRRELMPGKGALTSGLCVVQTTILYRLQVTIRLSCALSILTGQLQRLVKSSRQYPVSKSPRRSSWDTEADQNPFSNWFQCRDGSGIFLPSYAKFDISGLRCTNLVSIKISNSKCGTLVANLAFGNVHHVLRPLSSHTVI